MGQGEIASRYPAATITALKQGGGAAHRNYLQENKTAFKTAGLEEWGTHLQEQCSTRGNPD